MHYIRAPIRSGVDANVNMFISHAHKLAGCVVPALCHVITLSCPPPACDSPSPPMHSSLLTRPRRLGIGMLIRAGHSRVLAGTALTAGPRYSAQRHDAPMRHQEPRQHTFASSHLPASVRTRAGQVYVSHISEGTSSPLI